MFTFACLLRRPALSLVFLLLAVAHGATSSDARAASAAVDFRIVPGSVELVGNFARAQLLVVALDGQGRVDEFSADLTHEAHYQSSRPEVVSVSKSGRLLAVADGQAKVTVLYGGRSRQVDVEVKGVVERPVVNFTEQIEPVLSKASCNAAACHSSQYGKGGFKLSVFGFAPDEDYQAIVRDRQARRVNLMDPEQSLVLLKPALSVPHGGNRRLTTRSVEYEMFRAWLAAGAPPPKGGDAKVTSLVVTPQSRYGREGFSQQLRVVAAYTDGTQRDVTALARYDTLNDGVAGVDEDGRITTVGRGMAPVLVRFEGQAQVVNVGVPYSEHDRLEHWKDNNFIDTLAGRKFRELGIDPSPLCDDATFVRRVYLDAVGTVPTVDETRAFLESDDPDKRSRLIDRLLGLTGDPALDTYNNEYAAYWSLKWADLIRASSDNVGEQGMWAIYNWIKESMRANKPYDQFVRELVLANGSIYMNGPANYYRIATNPTDLAETTAQLFLGVRLQCAKCHHHPFEKYSQEDYYGFAAFFARVGTKNSSEFGLFGREQVVVVRPTGDVRHPKTNQVMAPTPLEGQPITDEVIDRRQGLADWLTSRDNEFFARNVVNRYMGYLMGRGLVEPIDDLRATNPASNPELLDALARDFVEHGFDLKHLIRTIMSSRLYQLDSQPTPANAGDDRFYSHFRVKRIAAEPLLDAIDRVTGVQTKFRNLPPGTRAIELPDSNYPDYFLTTFGKPRRVSVCECERAPDPNLSQALHTLNGEMLTSKIGDKSGRIARLLAAKTPHEQIVAELYLAALSRLPDKKELAALEPFRKDSPDERVFYEDLLWTLINSKQFLFVR